MLDNIFETLYKKLYDDKNTIVMKHEYIIIALAIYSVARSIKYLADAIVNNMYKLMR